MPDKEPAAEAVGRRMRLYLKDAFTAGNALAGFAAAVFAMRGNLVMAALMMPVAMFFDAFDGIVARVTRKFNKFGGEFDNVADHMSYGVAPGFILFGAYEPVFRDELGWHPLLAMAAAFAVGSVPLFFASVRFARFNTYHYNTPGYWLGVPRPATGFALAALVNSHVFSYSLESRLACVLLVLMFGFLNASTFPYLNHHGAGKTPKIVWFYYFFFVVTGLGTILLAMLGILPHQFLGDAMLFSMSVYSLLGWMEVPESARDMAAQAVVDAEKQQDANATAPMSRPRAPRKPLQPVPDEQANRLAAMAYLAGPLSGLYLLDVRRVGHPHVRFHAWQATMSPVAILLPILGLWILHGMIQAVWPTFSLLGLLKWPMAVWFPAWYVALVVSAARGKRLHAPFIGVQSEKQMQ